MSEPWWERINQCWAMNKNGRRCKNKVRKGFYSEVGECVVFFTCYLHARQENEIRQKEGAKMLAYVEP